MGSEGHALVEPYVVADLSRLSDDHACAMVDEEVIPNGGAGMDIDPRDAVGVLRHHPGKERNRANVEFMGNPVGGNSHDGRVAEDDLIETLRCRVATVRGSDVSCEPLSQARDLLEKMQGLGLAAVQTMGTDDIVPVTLMPNGPGYLMGKFLKYDIDLSPEVISQVVPIDLLVAKVARKKEILDILDQSDNRVSVWNGHGINVVNGIFILTAFDNGINDSRKLSPEVLSCLKGYVALLSFHCNSASVSFRHKIPRKD